MPAVRGLAEALPLDDNAIDASMATLTVHQWADRSAGLREMRRVTRGAVVILTFDPDAFDRFWLFEYAARARGDRTPTLPIYRNHLRSARRSH